MSGAFKSKSTLNELDAADLYTSPSNPAESIPDEEQKEAGTRTPTDSSIIYRVTLQSASLFVGRPASEFTTSRPLRGSGPHDYVRYVNILMMVNVFV